MARLYHCIAFVKVRIKTRRSVRGECRHAVRKRCEWPASYSGVRKRVSVQFTFAAAVRGWTERVAFMSAKKPFFFASLHKLLSLERENKLSLYSLTAVFFCGCKRKGKKKNHNIFFATFRSLSSTF